MSNQQGKTVLVTGASRGIGEGIAKECLRRGMNLIACARTLPNFPEPALCRTVDVRDASQVEGLAKAAVVRFGSIDLWINNAGVLGPIAPLRTCDPKEVRDNLDVNIMGVVHGCQSFARHLRSREGTGVLINISSGASTSAYEGWAAYCASKSAVDRLTEVVQAEEKDAGLHAYSVAPGIVDTGMQELIRSTSKDNFPAVEKFHELKRDDAFSSMEFVAKSLLDLAFGSSTKPDEVCIRLPPGK